MPNTARAPTARATAWATRSATAPGATQKSGARRYTTGEKRGPGQEAAEVENEASKKQESPRLRLLLRKQGSPRLRLRLLFQSLAGVPEPGLSLLYRPRRDWSRRECLMPLRCSV